MNSSMTIVAASATPPSDPDRGRCFVAKSRRKRPTRSIARAPRSPRVPLATRIRAFILGVLPVLAIFLGTRALLAEAFRIPSGLFAWQHCLEIRDSRLGPPVAAPSLHEWGQLVAPADTYFMMGDNRDDSVDSRYYGPVPRTNLRGTPTFVYYSYDPERGG